MKSDGSRDKLRNLLELDYPAERYQIVVVSDGSDGRHRTTILARVRERSAGQVVDEPVSRGKASGLNDAIQLAKGEIVVFTDARQKIEPGAMRLLMENFADPEVGCVSGELMLGDPESGESGQGMGLYWRIEKKDSRTGVGLGFGGGRDRSALRGAAEVAAPMFRKEPFWMTSTFRCRCASGKACRFDARARAWDRPGPRAGREFAARCEP